MEEIIKLETVAEYNKLRGVETLHPLITVIDLSKTKPMPAQTFNFGLYAIYLKELKKRSVESASPAIHSIDKVL